MKIWEASDDLFPLYRVWLHHSGRLVWFGKHVFSHEQALFVASVLTDHCREETGSASVEVKPYSKDDWHKDLVEALLKNKPALNDAIDSLTTKDILDYLRQHSQEKKP